ncbi:MAG: hypothetical protein GY717_16735 [Rhodobacteraceae bacterium]|nr:hypothetical protein [Paracoccaceae bacterium]
MRRLLYIFLILVLAVCAAPVIMVFWAGWFAERHGCTLHEGFSNPCLVNGQDWGETLYTAFVMGWLMLVTVPVGAIAALALLATVIIDLLRKTRRRRT